MWAKEGKAANFANIKIEPAGGSDFVTITVDRDHVDSDSEYDSESDSN